MIESAGVLLLLGVIALALVVAHAFVLAVRDERALAWSPRRESLRALAVVGTPERVLSRQCWMGRHRHCRPDRWQCECKCHGFLP